MPILILKDQYPCHYRYIKSIPTPNQGKLEENRISTQREINTTCQAGKHRVVNASNFVMLLTVFSYAPGVALLNKTKIKNFSFNCSLPTTAIKY